MKNIFRIIKKNLKLLIRSKSSALIIIIAPLLIILLVGLAFDNTNTYGLNIGVYSPEENENVDSFIQILNENQFKIVKYKNEQECVEEIKMGVIHTCVVFPSDFQFNSNIQKKVSFYVDYSKINLVYMILEKLSEKISEKSKEVSQDLTKELINKIENTKKTLKEEQDSIKSAKTTSQNTKETLYNINKQLTSLDFKYDEEGLPISSLKNMLSNTRDSIKDNIDTSIDQIDDARSDVDSSSASDPEKEEITSLLNGAKSSLNTAKNYITNTDNNSLIVVGQLITQIQNNLDETKNKLKEASKFKSGTEKKINDLDSSLASALKKINSLETAVNNIISDLESISVTKAETIAAPIESEIKPLTTEKTYLNYLFPSLIILVVMFISLLLGTTLVMMEKHSPAHFRNFIAPTSNLTFILATYLTNMFLVFIQIIIILSIAIYFFSTQIIPSLANTLLILIISASLFTFLGMLVGYLFKSEETATLASISLGSLFLFLSSTIIPLESMPYYFRKAASFNPFVISEKLVRQIIIFKPHVKHLSQDIFVLLGYIVFLFIIILLFHTLAQKHFLKHWSYKHHQAQREEKKRKEKNHAKKGKRKSKKSKSGKKKK